MCVRCNSGCRHNNGLVTGNLSETNGLLSKSFKETKKLFKGQQISLTFMFIPMRGLVTATHNEQTLEQGPPLAWAEISTLLIITVVSWSCFQHPIYSSGSGKSSNKKTKSTKLELILIYLKFRLYVPSLLLGFLKFIKLKKALRKWAIFKIVSWKFKFK